MSNVEDEEEEEEGTSDVKADEEAPAKEPADLGKPDLSENGADCGAMVRVEIMEEEAAALDIDAGSGDANMPQAAEVYDRGSGLSFDTDAVGSTRPGSFEPEKENDDGDKGKEAETTVTSTAEGKRRLQSSISMPQVKTSPSSPVIKSGRRMQASPSMPSNLLIPASPSTPSKLQKRASSKERLKLQDAVDLEVGSEPMNS